MRYSVSKLIKPDSSSSIAMDFFKLALDSQVGRQATQAYCEEDHPMSEMSIDECDLVGVFNVLHTSGQRSSRSSFSDKHLRIKHIQDF